MEKDNSPEKAIYAGSSLNGRNALVVGGTGGIGRAVVQALEQRGAAVTVHGRSKPKVEALVEEIRARKGVAYPFIHEITDPAAFLDSLKACVAGLMVGRADGGVKLESSVRDVAPFDIVVVAYGPFVQKPLAEHSVADWQTAALLDLALPGALASWALPGMTTRHFGRFLFFGGTKTDAIRAYKSNAAYAAAKTGLGVLAKSIAAEGALYDVAAITVCPGIVKTEYLEGEGLAAAGKAVQTTKGGRLLEPSWIAETALSLLEKDPCLASGAVVSLDAGLTSWT
jgi:NAD(P)-dependent dehydrogenase (short-subunit alcohol dehydrogenase family)